jgi:hypothetical protein
LPKLKNRPISEKSSNLVALLRRWICGLQVKLAVNLFDSLALLDIPA